MGSVLREAGIAFETSIDGTKLSVPIGETAQARALLAEKGLPGSRDAGYELFDKLGALGLTSFMQEVTRVRALEGELSRTIQNLKGIVPLACTSSFPTRTRCASRSSRRTASVVIRTDIAGDARRPPRSSTSWLPQFRK